LPEPLGTALSRFFYLGNTYDLRFKPQVRGRIPKRLMRRDVLGDRWVGYRHPYDEAIAGLRAVLSFRGPVLRSQSSPTLPFSMLLAIGALFLLEFGLSVPVGAAVRDIGAGLSAVIWPFFERLGNAEFTIVNLGLSAIASLLLILAGLYLILGAFSVAPRVRRAIGGLFGRLFGNPVGKLYRFLANKFLRRTMRDVATGRDVPDAYRFVLDDVPIPGAAIAELPEEIWTEIEGVTSQRLAAQSGAIGKILAGLVDDGGDIVSVIGRTRNVLQGGELLHTAYFLSPQFRQRLINDILVAIDRHGAGASSTD
jgi:hypothetical protein